MTIKPYHCQRK